MAGYTVLATRYRPRAFDDVVGQEDAARVLRAGLAGQRSGHAYLFSGPRGVGKTSMARILAKAWNCLSAEGEPCGACAVCRAIDEGSDCLDVVEIDGASHNRVENVRELIETLRFRPVEARHRVTIVDEVHMLSTSAFNALLKTLEEPPSHAKFILATTEPLKVPETIRSRCQLIDFRRLQSDEIAARLAHICKLEQVPAPPGLCERIARHARGGLRDALSLLDQLIAYGDGQPTLEAFERLTGRLSPQALHAVAAAALAGDTAAALAAGADAMSRGARPADLVEQLTDLLQGTLVTAAGGQAADRTSEEQAALAQLAARGNVDQLVAMLDVLVEAAARLRQRHDGRLVIELALVALSRVPMLQDVADVLARGQIEAPRLAQPAPAGARATTPQPPPMQAGSRPTAAAPRPAAMAPAPAAPAPVSPEEAAFTARFIEAAARDSRSLRADLQRWASIRIVGEDLVLAAASGAAAPLFDPREPQIRQRLLEAAREVTGRTLDLRVVPAAGDPPATGAQAAGAARPAASAPRPGAPPPAAPRPAAPPSPPRTTPPAGSRGTGDLDKRILGDWPGAERIDF